MSRHNRKKCSIHKGIDLSVFGQDDLDAVVWVLQERLFKSLRFKSLGKLFSPDTFDADEFYRRINAFHT